MPGVGPEGSSTSVREGRCIMTVRFTTVETANRVGRKNGWLGKGWSWSRSCSWSPVGDPAGDLAALDEVGGPAGRDGGGEQRRGRWAAYGRPVGGAAAPTSVRPSSGRRAPSLAPTLAPGTGGPPGADYTRRPHLDHTRRLRRLCGPRRRQTTGGFSFPASRGAPTTLGADRRVAQDQARQLLHSVGAEARRHLAARQVDQVAALRADPVPVARHVRVAVRGRPDRRQANRRRRLSLGPATPAPATLSMAAMWPRPAPLTHRSPPHPRPPTRCAARA